MKHICKSTAFRNAPPRTTQVVGSRRGRERPHFGRLWAAQNFLRSHYSLGVAPAHVVRKSLRVNPRTKEKQK